MLHGTEAASARKTEERKTIVAEMRMLRWNCGVTREDRVRNAHIRRSTNVTEVSKKLREGRLRWYGNIFVVRRDPPYKADTRTGSARTKRKEG